MVRPGFYGIYEPVTGRLEMYQLMGRRFQPMGANERGHFPIPDLGLELGIWKGEYQNVTWPWARWYDLEGRLLPTGHELAEQVRQRADLEQQRVEQERQRAERLAERLRELGIEPDA